MASKLLLFISLIVIFSSCNSDRVSCDMKEGIEMNRYNLKLQLTKMLALKYAAEAYTESKKGFWGIDFSDEYKLYLKMNFEEAENQTGKYFQEAEETLSDKTFLIKNIVPISFNKGVNKCVCEADLKITDLDITDQFSYNLTRNTEGELVGHFSYNPDLRIDNEEYNYITQILKDVTHEKNEFDKRAVTKNVDRDESWRSFWRNFKTAFHNKDKQKLVSLCSEDFFSGGSGYTPSEWVTYIFEHSDRYAIINKAIKNGVNDHTWRDGSKSKVTGNGDMNDLYFDFIDNGWFFGGIVGD